MNWSKCPTLKKGDFVSWDVLKAGRNNLFGQSRILQSATRSEAMATAVGERNDRGNGNNDTHFLASPRSCRGTAVCVHGSAMGLDGRAIALPWHRHVAAMNAHGGAMEMTYHVLRHALGHRYGMPQGYNIMRCRGLNILSLSSATSKRCYGVSHPATAGRPPGKHAPHHDTAMALPMGHHELPWGCHGNAMLLP